MLALRPEFLPMMGSRKAVNAQNDSAFGFFCSLLSPAVPRPSCIISKSPPSREQASRY
jgi:hypothetical protein